MNAWIVIVRNSAWRRTLSILSFLLHAKFESLFYLWASWISLVDCSTELRLLNLSQDSSFSISWRLRCFSIHDAYVISTAMAAGASRYFWRRRWSVRDVCWGKCCTSASKRRRWRRWWEAFARWGQCWGCWGLWRETGEFMTFTLR